MFRKLSAVSALALVLSPAFVAAGSHDTPQRRHGHAGLSRMHTGGILFNNTLGANHTVDPEKRDFENARFTMYYQTGNAGACGIYNSDQDFVRAHQSLWSMEVELIRCRSPVDRCLERWGKLLASYCINGH